MQQSEIEQAAEDLANKNLTDKATKLEREAYMQGVEDGIKWGNEQMVERLKEILKKLK